MEKTALTRGAVHSVVFDTIDIIVCCSIIDALINVVADVSVREAMSEIVVHSLVDFLVVIVAQFISTTSVAGVPTTVVMTGLSIAVVVIVFLSEGIW